MKRGDHNPPIRYHNFSAAPGNRWSFNHMREIWPTRSVNTPGHSHSFARAPQNWWGFELKFGNLPPMSLDAWLSASMTDAFLVLHRGQLVYEVYPSGQHPSQAHVIFSVTKSVTGLLALIALERGLISEDALVKDYLPAHEASAFGDATIAQILNMSNSLDYSEVYDDPAGHFAAYIESVSPAGQGLESFILGLKNKEEGREHGTGFHYATVTTDLLVCVLEKTIGMSLADIFRRWVFEPMGGRDEAYYCVDPLGFVWGGAGLCLSARDMLRLGQVVLNDGEGCFAPEVAKRIKTRRNAEIFGACYDDDWYGSVGYGYADQWWGSALKNAVTGVGIFGQFLYIDEDADLVIAKQSSHFEASNDKDMDAFVAFAQITDFLANKP